MLHALESPTVGYRFGEFELNLHTRELTHYGSMLPLRRQPFDLLAYLIAHRSRVVPKSELFAVIWHDASVCDSSLQQCVSMIRRALGDSRCDQQLVKTHSRVGYRFVGRVEVLTEELQDPDYERDLPMGRAQPMIASEPHRSAWRH